MISFCVIRVVSDNEDTFLPAEKLYYVTCIVMLTIDHSGAVEWPICTPMLLRISMSYLSEHITRILEFSYTIFLYIEL